MLTKDRHMILVLQQECLLQTNQPDLDRNHLEEQVRQGLWMAPWRSSFVAYKVLLATDLLQSLRRVMIRMGLVIEVFFLDLRTLRRCKMRVELETLGSTFQCYRCYPWTHHWDSLLKSSEDSVFPALSSVGGWCTSVGFHRLACCCFSCSNSHYSLP